MTHKSLQISYRTIAAFALGVAAVLLVMVVSNAAGAAPPASGQLVGAQPQLVTYQGTVDLGGTPYEGTGFFKFAIVDAASGDGTVNYWANDGTASGEPSQTVPMTVNGGLFSVLLGDTSITGMTTALTDAAFSSGETFLRVWFGQELAGPFSALEPNQRIGSVPYALRATYAEIGPAMVPAGAVMFFDAASCPAGWSPLEAARGRAIVGLPSGGTLNGTRGTALTDREDRAHTHSVNPAAVNTSSNGSHSHTTGEPTRKGAVALTAGSIFIDYGESDHLHSVSTNGNHNHSVNLPATASTAANTSDVIPYIQLLACKKD